MKRIIFSKLLSWKRTLKRKPIILRGARQVGKTHVVRALGKHFEHFVEINFERSPIYKRFFKQDLQPQRIIEMLGLETGQRIIPGKTLLFFDEIQECPAAIIALRYFYEELSELHVIAAGSLLDFAIEKVGVPVGRVSFLYMYPLSFIEFLIAADKEMIAQAIMHHQPNEAILEVIHTKFLHLLGEYMLTGGMPEVVYQWVTTRDLEVCSRIQREIIASYQQDFSKYCNKFQLKYVELIFEKIPSLISQPFKYSHLESPYQRRELEPCLDLLIKANVVHRVSCTSAQGVPLGATVNFNKFKLLFVDIALCQTMLGFSLKNWILNPSVTFAEMINKGALCEALVGQELLVYADSDIKTNLYYWHRAARGSQAEVDYIIAKQQSIIPVEVKSGKGSTLKSMHYFLKTRESAPYGIRFSTQDYSIYDDIYSYPLYAVAAIYSDNPLLRNFLSLKDSLD